MQTNEIIQALNNPNALENLYQTKQTEFLAWWLAEATEKYPESETLQVWNARITFSNIPASNKSVVQPVHVFFISIIAGTLVKLHTFIDTGWYLSRFVPVIVIGSLMTYFSFLESHKNKNVPILGILICINVLLLLPDVTSSASITMSLIHMPLVLLSLLALTFMGDDWESDKLRILFVRYLGEVLIYTVIILLGGIVLTFLTLALFSLIHIDMTNWYLNNVVVFGLVASPIVATYLYDVVLGRESRLATIIANIFSPLVLVTVCVYLLAIIVQGKSPYVDRDFLITINGLLLVVLAITIYSLSGKGSISNRPLTDTINICLVAVTLVINVYALSAILFRLAEYGISPNRVSVTGANILIFGHLILILNNYIAHIRHRYSSERLLNTVTKYFPFYTGWSVLMVIGLPVAFGFR